MASFRQIAEDAGVSIATVSRVLNANPTVNEDARERVLDAVNRFGYVRKVGKRSVAEGIALAYAGPVSVESPFDHGLLQGIGQAVDQTAGVERFGHDLLVISLQRSMRPNETAAELFLRKGIKGAVIRTTDQAIPMCEEIARTGFPSVVVGERFPQNSAVSFVDAESRSTSAEAVRYLLSLGHRRIAVVSNVHDDTDHCDRIAGWRDAHEEAGIDIDPSLIIRVWATLESGVQVAKRIHSLPKATRPTAGYLIDPMAAMGMLRGLQELGMSVPGDFSLVGFDDGNLRRLSYPMMTAVCQNAALLGEKAVELMRQLIARRSMDRRANGKRKPTFSKDAPKRMTLKTTFEVGATTGPPAHTNGSV